MLTDNAPLGQTKGRTVPPLVVGLVLGAAIWYLMMARYPLYSYGEDLTTGNIGLVPLLVLAAMILGYIEPRRPRSVALSLIAAPLALAAWTTPRGDDDGLWVLIFPMLVILGGALALFAQLGTWIRRAVERRRSDPKVL